MFSNRPAWMMTWAVVVTGAGKAFCAGMDLSVGGNVFGLDESILPP